jgi:hypothetical protein
MVVLALAVVVTPRMSQVRSDRQHRNTQMPAVGLLNVYPRLGGVPVYMPDTYAASLTYAAHSAV